MNIPANPAPMVEIDLKPLRALLAGIRRKMRTVKALEGLFLFLAFSIASGLLLLLLDNLFWLPGWLRATLGISCCALGAVILLGGVFLPLVRPLGDEAVALFTESRTKGLQNRLINPLQLSRESLTGWSRIFAIQAVREGVEALRSSSLIDPVDGGRARRLAKVLALPAIGFALYAVLFPAYALNGLERYARPFEWVNPLSDLSIHVKPGDVEVISGDPLTILTEVSGGFPERVSLLLSAGEDKEEIPVEFRGNGYAHTFPRVVQGFAYRARVGAILSPEYRVTVTPRPEVRTIDLALEFPAYTGRPPKVEKNADGHVKALKGTEVRITVTSSTSLWSARLTFEGGRVVPLEVEGNAARGSFTVTRRDAYAIRLVSERSIAGSNGIRYGVEAVPDQTPQVRMTAPGRDVTIAPGQTVNVHFKASDDVGLKAAVLFARKAGDEGGEKAVAGWKFAAGMTEASEGHPWDLSGENLKPGECLVYRVVVYDSNPASRGASTPAYRIRVESAERKKQDLATELADIVEGLKRLIRAQRMMRAQTEKAAQAIAKKRRFNAVRARKSVERLAQGQGKVEAEAGRFSGRVKGASPFESRVREVLAGLCADEFPRVKGAYQSALQERDIRKWAVFLSTAVRTQKQIVDALRRLLEQSRSILERVKELPPEEALQAPEAPLDRREFIEKAAVVLKEFMKEQREVIEATEELARKPVEDFTEEDDARAKELASIEDKLAELLKDLKDDLSRLPEQDLSDGTMVDELIEIYVEVELARDALTRKNIELAVPFEQAGVELAEQLTKNLEKWLPDVHDNIKWNMEDPIEDLEVPLADLPEELEDMVGDLIEESNDLAEEVEDVSSAWADSLDEGAGWATMDGPISNMSAQGKTGNYLPNNSEIGGRSGEGRTGRSHGQMVEKTAQGKGGRQTPFRLTPDAYEKGEVDDKSGDPGGGGTGGGKLSGSGAEGLRGPCPPQLAKELDRLKGRTVEIKEKAEKLDGRLRAHRYPAEQVGEAVLLLEKMEKQLKAGQTAGFGATKRILLDRLQDARAMIQGNLRLNREAASRVPKRLREELNNVAKEKMPEAYRDLLRRYYRALAEGK